MNNLTKNTEASQGAFQIPAVVPVKDSIAEFTKECVNMGYFGIAEINPHVSDLLHQNPAIKYANESVDLLKKSLHNIRQVIRRPRNTSLNLFLEHLELETELVDLLNKIEGAE